MPTAPGATLAGRASTPSPASTSCEPVRGPGAVGGEHDAVPVAARARAGGGPSASVSPTTGSKPVAARRGVSGASGVGSSDGRAGRRCARAAGRTSSERRGEVALAGRAPRGRERRRERGLVVEQLLGAVAHAAWARRAARARSSGSRSGSRCSRSVSHGSHDSMPSNTWPSARRSHCSRPHGSLARRARRRGRGPRRWGAARGPGRCTPRRRRGWSAGRRPRTPERRSTSSPQRSMRTGWSSVDGYTSTIEPRTATSPRASTWYSRRYPPATSRSTSSSRSTRSPGRTTTGSTSSTCGPRRCTSARTGATTTAGGRSPPARSRHITRRRRPIVSSDGDTRSNGSVSHAGNSSTSLGAEELREVVGEAVGLGAGRHRDERSGGGS